MEKQITRTEGIPERMDRRLSHTGAELMGLCAELRQDVRALRDRMGSNFRRTIGLMIFMWGTIILVILLRG